MPSRRSISQGHHLGVWAPGRLCVAFADRLAMVVLQYATDARIGVGQTQCTLGHSQSAVYL